MSLKTVSTLDCVCLTPLDLRKSVCKWLDQVKSPKTVVLLDGNLGAGKTELVRQYLEHHGYKDVMSPTFAIINKYEHPDLEITHVDLYRTETELEIESSGFWELFESNGLIFVEWSSRLGPFDAPNDWMTIKVEIRYEPSEINSARRIKAEAMK